MENTGALIANDYKGMRLAPLGINMQRIGSTNSALTVMHGQWFKDMEFDRVLVDAPCSGTGTIAKSLKTLDIWNPHMISKLANQQKKLLLAGWNVLKKGGVLVYSTCSVEPQENEGVVSWLLNEVDDATVEDIKLDIVKGEPIMAYKDETYHKDVAKTLRLWPQNNMTEGFFVCKLKKG
jgi:16S rRNA C967 or C1407 C5-methylase (RsmB/RsmF family)